MAVQGSHHPCTRHGEFSPEGMGMKRLALISAVIASALMIAGCGITHLPDTLPQVEQAPPRPAWPKSRETMVCTVNGRGRVDISYGSTTLSHSVTNVKMPWSGSVPFSLTTADWWCRAWVQGHGSARTMLWLYRTRYYESGKVVRRDLGVEGSGFTKKPDDGFASASWTQF